MSHPSTTTTSLSVRLIAGAVVWISLTLMVGGGVLAMAFQTTAEREFSYRLDALLRAMIAATDIAQDGTVTSVHPLGDPRFEQIFSGWYWQVTESTGQHVRSRSLWDSVISTTEGGSDLQTRHIFGPNGESLLVAERDLRFPSTPKPVHLIIAGDLREVSDGVRRFNMLLITSLGVLGVGMAIAVFIQVKFGLRPLRVLAQDLAAIRLGEAVRLTGRYPQEVAPLVQAMNGVLDKDADLIERARTHVGNLAHGLKTPLTIISAEMQSTPNKGVVEEQLQSMRRVIEHHLGRASASAGDGRMRGLKVSVRDVTETVAAALGRVFADRSLIFDIDIPIEVSFRGHRADLEEILGNLMENACKWATTTVRVYSCLMDGLLVMSVEDDGVGMTAEDAAKASERGRRLDELSPGWGLGLSIVSDLVDANGGQMSLGASPLGGLLVKVTLPL